MTNEEAITIIRNEYKCVDRDCDIERSCGKCDLMIPSKEPILEAYKLAIKALEQQPIEDMPCVTPEEMQKCKDIVKKYTPKQQPSYTVSRGAFEQVMWERDVAIGQLKELGYELGQKVEFCDDAIRREDALNGVDAMYNNSWDLRDFRSNVDLMLKELPPVTQKSGKCKNCKYFEYDSVAKVDGVPLIVAHEICNKWGNGCKTSEDGYCFLFEPQERSE